MVPGALTLLALSLLPATLAQDDVQTHSNGAQSSNVVTISICGIVVLGFAFCAVSVCGGKESSAGRSAATLARMA
ncbi:hypothetical protein GGX14DRAFT_446522 [Mycena pura]|uniref:Uncharacterized protein n=1 Tax=Mycena pura TaxID=153505 RepID=A0AAD6YH31_9AGAR|nr:hypothetical protein GGX14DRAFT_446522 [Mycena pura]